VLHLDRLMREQRVNGVAGILCFYQRLALAIIDASLIAQLALGIEDKNMRRGFGTIGARHCLRFAVVQVRKIEVPERGADFHFFKAVADIGITELAKPHRFGIVGLNRYQRDAAAAVIVRELLDAALVKLGGGAVVARENDNQHFRIRVVSQFMNLPVNSR